MGRPIIKMKIKVVFVCYGNSCRSIMAEAMARHFCGDRLEAASAGIDPLGHVAPDTLKVLEEIGVSGEGLRSKALEGMDLRDVSLLINLSEYSLKRPLPYFKGQILNQPMPDPFGLSPEFYRRTRDAIKQWIMEELFPAQETEPL
jgi:arsenate reductase